VVYVFVVVPCTHVAEVAVPMTLASRAAMFATFVFVLAVFSASPKSMIPNRKTNRIGMTKVNSTRA
jgi:hypothetical protein